MPVKIALAQSQGEIFWYDLQTNDVEGAIKFYTSLMGWGTTQFDADPDSDYCMFTLDGQPVAGVMLQSDMQTSKGVPPNWMSYASVPDINKALEEVKTLGGTVYSEIVKVPTVGEFFIFADAQGAAFSALMPEEAGNGEVSPAKPGEFSWHELATTDYEAAFEFYKKIFGWEFSMETDIGEGWIYKMFKKKGADFSYGGIFNRPEEMPFTTWVYYLRVVDMDAALARVKAGGGEVINGPMIVPGGDTTAQCRDPQGAMFALHMKP